LPFEYFLFRVIIVVIDRDLQFLIHLPDFEFKSIGYFHSDPAKTTSTSLLDSNPLQHAKPRALELH
jgi:hypothetical protein